MSSLSELALLPTKLLNNIILVGGKALAKVIKENTEPLDILEYISNSSEFSISHW
jgi:hypothetical protein